MAGSRFRFVLLGVLALALAAGAVVLAPIAAGFGKVEQPIAFNHRIHVEELGFECVDCHPYALTSMRATIPNIDSCADCHEEAQGESPAEARLVEYIAAGEPVPWRKVYWVPDHVFFSHRRHAAIAAIDCAECHGPVGEQSEPVSRAQRPPTMDDCMECHEASGASNDCIHCHS